MTPATLRARVKYWQRRLAPLGLGHYKIHVSVVEQPSEDVYVDARAAVSAHTHYDEAWMEFKEQSLAEDPEELIEIAIIHELLHVVMRDFDYSVETVEEYLGEPALSIWQDDVKHTREGFVERVARTLYLTSKV